MKSKLKLRHLKVDSFATKMESSSSKTAKGGTGYFENNYTANNNYYNNGNYNGATYNGGTYITLSHVYTDICAGTLVSQVVCY